MSTSVAAPAQPKQPSRKGKKAWRKNVDITEIQSGLQEVRDQIAQGGVITEKSSSELFQVDTTGSSELQKEVNKRHKPLKADEILAQRSAVPAISSRKRLSDFSSEPKSKKPRVSYKQLDKLRSIAYGGDQVQKDVVQTGDAATHDPWAPQVVHREPKFSFLEEKKDVREPATLKKAPVSLSKKGKPFPALPKPEAGKSYNPTVSDWMDVLQREGDKEVEAEKKRLQEARDEAKRMEKVMLASFEHQMESEEESAWESEWEGFQSEVEGEQLKKKRPERKTPSQRNKIKRRKEEERKAVHERKIKEREKQAQRIKELAKSVEEKEKARLAARELAVAAKEDSSSDDGEEVLRKKRFGKVQ
ncbi:P60-like protein [Zopfia rhizophila CBS 207.26]|uniref:Ribosome biogenesis protein NOP53 n=1 Tax=Zopfia rhizophila CBS 207.26 TaxID=1314779 RepID=A0A6A6EES4_9PEZI|nr:P60-like protein [Zopfia rhizophila CBS 207.26]